jgi:hypothetical protein
MAKSTFLDILKSTSAPINIVGCLYNYEKIDVNILAGFRNMC